MRKQPRFYLAYGLNLYMAGMRQRCPHARPAGIRLMADAKLVFRGVADIEYHPGGMVPCGLWEISASDEAALDRYEGVAGGLYDKYDIKIGRNRTALVYFMNDRGRFPPSEYYADVIRDGYRDFGLDESYLDAAIAEALGDKKVTVQTITRRARQKATELQRRLVRLPESLALSRLGVA